MSTPEKTTPKDGAEQELTSESKMTTPEEDSSAIVKDLGSEERQISESKMTTPEEDSSAIVKDLGSEERQISESKMTTPEEDSSAIVKDLGSEERQISESTMSTPEKDSTAIVKDLGSEERQMSDLLAEEEDVMTKAGKQGNLQDYKAHVIAKFDTSVALQYDSPEMKVLSDAFKPDQKTFRPHTIILHGRPGVGKSALARSIVLGWAQGKLYQDMSYVVIFSVGEIKWTEKSSLAQMIAKEWPDSWAPVTKIMSQPERLLFVIDGFDDMDAVLQDEDDMTLSRDWKDEQPIYILIYSLLRKALLPESFLIITTRNTGLEKLKSVVVSPLYILVEGLSTSRRSQLILENISDDYQRMQVFHSVIENHQLFNQCQAPSMCLLICEALQLQKKLGKECTLPCQTLTGLYATLLFHRLTLREPSWGTLSQEEQITLVGLCRMAAEGVWTMKSVFYDDDLKNYSLKESEISALFHTKILLQVGHRSEKSSIFFHRSLQDFFAALYYVLEELGEWNQYFSFIKNQQSIMEVKRTNNIPLGMKRFLFGLMNKDILKTLEVLFGCPINLTIKQKLQHWVSLIGQQVNDTNPMDTLDAFYYLFESQDEEFVHVALNSFQEVWLLINQKMDLTVSSYCLQQCQNLKAIRVDIRALISEDNTLELCPLVDLQKKLHKPLKECWKNFSSVLSTHPNLKELDLGNSILNKWAMEILCLKLGNSSCSIQKLMFKNAEIESGLQYLWKLVSNPNIKSLNLGSTPMTDDDMKLACDALRHPRCSLETLRLDSCELTLAGYEMISTLLLSTTSLKCLSLARNKVGENSMIYLGDALRSSECSLKKLILDGCDLPPESCHVLASALFSNQSLTHLCLSNNNLGTKEVQQLCQVMKTPECALQRLILNHCNIVDAAAYGFLALILSSYRKLTHLSLSMNPVGDNAMKLLCEALKEPACYLQELELVDCQLTENCCEDIACMIPIAKHLQSLDLGNNALGDKGVIALCEGLKQNTGSLRRLGLGACELTSKCCEVLSLVIASNSRLKSLNLVMNDFSTAGMLKLCCAFQCPATSLSVIGLWKQQYYAEVRKQLEEVQSIKPHVVIDGDWYSIDEDDRNWWKN
ncbi:NACHT, LRR and PYD domains-containing protein 5-like isoform X2 [Arvicanthis niloticus]|uniref:NACHT, LRR and PYD domains-containing protein 5-like isoform X2 n=1 Tax=Arvicanthis niloticus TaxID=61156 RepID=UPI00402B1348